MTETLTTPTSAPVHASRATRLLRGLGSVLVPLVVLGSATGILVASTHPESWTVDHAIQTEDAQLRADITPLSTKSTGVVAVVAVEDYQRVKAGDLLVLLKDDDFRAQVDLAEAAVRAARAALKNLQAQRATQGSRIGEAQANIQAANADVNRSHLERLRQEALEKDRVATEQKVEVAVADDERYQAIAGSRRAEFEAQRRQFAVLDAQEIELIAEISAKEASLVLAKVNLDYTRIVAPTDGVVGERKVRPGQLVSAGTQVISLVGDTVWVIANFKETQLPHLHVGAPMAVTVDGVPRHTWMGRIENIAPASGSQFSLLPPDNATGNFTKIAQRMPVKIVLDARQPEAQQLRAGMSAVVTLATQP